jgi:hypothetical protein
MFQVMKTKYEIDMKAMREEMNQFNQIMSMIQQNPKLAQEWRFTAFQNTRAHFIGRPEESQALTEELRHELLTRK